MWAQTRFSQSNLYLETLLLVRLIISSIRSTVVFLIWKPTDSS